MKSDTPSRDGGESGLAPLMRELASAVNAAKAIAHLDEAIADLERAYEMEQKQRYWTAWELIQQAKEALTPYRDKENIPPSATQ